MGLPESASVSGTTAPSFLLGKRDVASLGEDAFAEVQQFAGAESEAQLQEQLDVHIEAEVEAIVAAMDGCDAFDLIELLRLRELPIVPVAGLTDGYDGIAAVIDLVGLVLLTREGRMPAGRDRLETQPHEVISELHDRAARLVRLTTYMNMARTVFAQGDPLTRLSGDYQSFLLTVRGMQYESIQVEHDTALFDRPEIDEIVVAKLGFCYRDFAAVRAAIQSRYSRTLTALRDGTGDIFAQAQAEGRDLTDQEGESVRSSMVEFLFLPGERASFTVADIVDETGLEASRVEEALRAFSTTFESRVSAVRVVRDFLRGVNPLTKTSLVHDGAGNYLMMSTQIGADSFRLVAESALKPDATAWRRYDRARAQFSESLAVARVAQLLQTPAAHTNLRYYSPKSSDSFEVLNRHCQAPAAVGDQTECDSLFLIQDVAICVEVKGRTIAESARRGDSVRLRREIDKIFGDGARQATRLETLIKTNGGIWREQDGWLDLSGVREIRSIVIGLDSFGPLAVALGDLRRAGALGEGAVPWIASLHDLDVISKVIDRPAEFLLYLRRRTDSDIATHFRGADELDLFMLFLGGGLYVPPDPVEVQRLHPSVGSPTGRETREHARDARPTQVGTYTDPLDAWMYWVEGTSPYPAEKPTFNTHPSVTRIVDFLIEGRKPGWLRLGADMLGLSGQTQKRLGKQLDELVAKTREDGRGHSLVQGWAGLWGYPTFFAATVPRSEPLERSAAKLRDYMAAKKYQVGSDRSLGLLLNERRDIVRVVYMNDMPTADDTRLEMLGSQIGLQAVEESRRPIPPSARRTTRRLRGATSSRRGGRSR